MQPFAILSIVLVYFLALTIVSYITGKGANNNTFFTGDHNSPWYVVAYGMIGASLSGVTFISVPGWVGNSSFSYMQMVLGYLLGYFVIAQVLLPLYYRLNLTSIYTYLEQRFGFWSYKTGAAYFILSRVLGASFRLYLVANVLQITMFEQWNIPFHITVMVTILFIWLYTFKGGIKTIVWTDTLQTTFMLLSVGITVYLISKQLHWNVSEAYEQIKESSYSKIFFSGRLGRQATFCKTVFQWSIHCYCHDWAGPGYDAKKPDVPNVEGCTEKHVRLQHCIGIRKHAFSGTWCIVVLICQQPGHFNSRKNR